jgi:acetaldehyde/propanal dehydrogenase
VPPVNLREHADKVEMNVNMISCAGQATIPIVNAVSRMQSVAYAEIVASLASKSVGPGTRANLDEFTYTTSSAIEVVGGARKGKALAIINPAEPPMIMRNTIFCVTDEAPDGTHHRVHAGDDQARCRNTCRATAW